MAKYQYADAQNNLKTIEASSAEAAMASAKDIGKSSGVRLLPSKVKNVGTSTDAGNLGNTNLPTPPTKGDTAGDGIAGALSGISSLSVEQQSAKDAAAPFATQPSALENEGMKITRDLIAELQKTRGKTARTAELQDEAGVSTYEEQLRTYRKQLNQEQSSLQKSLDAVSQGQAAGTLAFADVRSRRLQRESLANQTDISINSEIAQGNLEGAMKQVENKLKIEYGDIEDNIAIQKSTLEMLTPFMTTEQARAAENKKNELAFYMSDVQQKKDLERMDYQAKLNRQQASFEAGLKAAAESSVYSARDAATDKNLNFFLNNAKLKYGKTAAAQKLLEQAYNQNVSMRGSAGGYETLLGVAFDGTDQKALDGIKEAQSGYKRLDEFYANNPDFDTSYAKQKANNIAKYAGGQDLVLTEFNAITNEIESSLRALKTGLSLTGFELEDSTQRYFTETDTLASYTKKMDNLRASLDAQLKSKVDNRLGSGFYDGYRSSLDGGNVISDDDWNAPPKSGASVSSGALSMDAFNRASGAAPSSSSSGILTLPADFSGFSNYLFR